MGKITDPAMLAQLGSPPAVPAGATMLGTQDPGYAMKAPQSVADYGHTNAETNSSNANAARAGVQTAADRAALPYAGQIAASEAAQKAAEAEAAKAKLASGMFGNKPLLTDDARNQSLQKIAALQLLAKQTDRVAVEYNRSQGGAGKGILHSAGELVPALFSSDNAKFDASISGLAPLARAAFRVPGTGSDSDKESAAFMGLLPSRWNNDSANAQDINQMRQIIQQSIAQQKGLLGVPAQAKPAGKPNTSGFKVIR